MQRKAWFLAMGVVGPTLSWVGALADEPVAELTEIVITAQKRTERLADVPVDVEIASEFRYREPALRAGTLAIAVSQSGETADTLAALRWCKSKGLATAAIVSQPTVTSR